MLSGRLRLTGLLIVLLGAVAGCASADAGSPSMRADVAVASYTPPAGAPAFCARLAASTHLADLPSAVGLLTAEPADVETKLGLGAAIEELRGVLLEVRREGGQFELDSSIAELVDALQQTGQGPVTDSVRAAIADGLDDVGTRVQPLCGFPG
jgi:hypothetical protein